MYKKISVLCQNSSAKKKIKTDCPRVGHQRERWCQNYCRKIEWKLNQTQVVFACFRAPWRGAARERIHQINLWPNSTGGLLMRSPVLLSPVQPCPTRTKHAASYIPPRARREGQAKRRCGRTEGKKGGGRCITGRQNGKLCFDFIFLCGSKAFDFGLKGD